MLVLQILHDMCSNNQVDDPASALGDTSAIAEDSRGLAAWIIILIVLGVCCCCVILATLLALCLKNRETEKSLAQQDSMATGAVESDAPERESAQTAGAAKMDSMKQARSRANQPSAAKLDSEPLDM